tara:strand:+ start:3450 stop:4094 length:645 start_codon:yes stop_codon:yes gene_type:complete
MEKIVDFFPKRLLNIFRKRSILGSVQRETEISKISKGKSVSNSDINTETSYIILVKYDSGEKSLYNDVTIKEYNRNKKFVSFVYNKHYQEFKQRDKTSPKTINIRNFANIKFYYTKKSNPISPSDIKLSSSNKSKSTSNSKSSSNKVVVKTNNKSNSSSNKVVLTTNKSKKKSNLTPRKYTMRTMSSRNRVAPYPLFNTSESFLDKKGGRKIKN